jgi:hypothetical protein
MKELLFGLALGYLAFTENGHLIGNKAADIIAKNAKKTADEYMVKIFGDKKEESTKDGDHQKVSETDGRGAA